ncbi:maleylpyruvate isomerase family mycothiol-dependent enzyme [Kribbella sp. NPDC051718]|uniref:maleylpyruvate isomerase family mycothiol-dependent enzyme n=1 Tax=Kribbella sp. NPDC051718 TaxID=3155168 RepID=UPI003449143B
MNLFADAGAELVRVVGSLPSTHWDNPTPAGLTVREVVDHVVAGNRFAVRLLAGASAADAVAGLDADQLGDDAIAAVSTSCEDQRSAFAAADQRLPLHHPSGDISYDTFVRFRLGDVLIHSWDIAVGGRLDPTLDPALVDALWAIVEPHLDEMRAMGVFGTGASNTLPPGASRQTRLLGAFGRRVDRG